MAARGALVVLGSGGGGRDHCHSSEAWDRHSVLAHFPCQHCRGGSRAPRHIFPSRIPGFGSSSRGGEAACKSW